MTKALARTAFLACLVLLAIPSAASARGPVLWAGSTFNDLGPASTILAVRDGKASVRNVQLILACTDAEDGSESARAFDARYRTREPLNASRSTSRRCPEGGSAGFESTACCAPTAEARRACASRRPPPARAVRSSSAVAARCGCPSAAAPENARVA